MKLVKIVLACMLAFMIASCDGTIGADKNPAKLESISANIASGKVFLAGQEFAKDKVIVTATYDDGSTKTVPSADWELNAAGFDKTKLDTPQEVNISYQGKTTSVQVTVEAYKKFVVVAVAGQSNSVGYDESDLDAEDVAKDVYRVMEVSGGATPAITRLDYCAHNMQDMRGNVYRGDKPAGRANYTKGIHLPLANLLLAHIPEDYGVLIVPVAYGGTAVAASGSGTSSTMWCTTQQSWGPQTNYSYTLQNRIKWTLDQNTENKFAGIVWCQGENNAGSLDALKTGFPAMVSQINTFLTNAGFASRTKKGTIDNGLWFIYESTDAYMRKGDYASGGSKTTSLPNASAVWAYYKEWNNDNYVELRVGIPLNPTKYTSGTPEAHFGQNAFRTDIAPAVVAKMVSAGVLW